MTVQPFIISLLNIIEWNDVVDVRECSEEETHGVVIQLDKHWLYVFTNGDYYYYDFHLYGDRINGIRIEEELGNDNGGRIVVSYTSGKHLFLKADNATKIGVRLDDVSITKEIGMDI